ncbi:MAG: MoaD/ThiS family protein [Myxococcaceae bacterium]|nr:MAG: MoaD/ThiS family protein [Myxococcaceae bacterium]
MAITVRVPTQLRTLTAGKEEVSGTGATVGELIDHLEGAHPGIKDRLLDAKGIRRFVNLYLNEDDVRFLDGLNTPVKDTDTLTIVPAIAGG